MLSTMVENKVILLATGKTAKQKVAYWKNEITRVFSFCIMGL
jgi:hypothetical protein